jgi:hypothetical protein
LQVSLNADRYSLAAWRRIRPSAGGEDTFTYGLMYQRRACQADDIEQALPRVAGRRRNQAMSC